MIKENKINLSEIYNKQFSINELLYYMLINDIDILINDLSLYPYVEYEIGDLKFVWNDLRNCLDNQE